MRIHFLIFTGLLGLTLFSCNGNQPGGTKNETAENKTPVGSDTIDAGVQVDSSVCNSYAVTSDTAYLFDEPRVSARRKGYLLKNRLIQGYRAGDKYIQVGSLSSESDTIHGWLLLRDLELIRFTPPKITGAE
jgi:hypothetical protein